MLNSSSPLSRSVSVALLALTAFTLGMTAPLQAQTPQAPSAAPDPQAPATTSSGSPVLTEPAPTFPAMEELSPGVYRIGKLHLDKNTLSVTFPATVNMDEGNLEYLLVTPQGSTHESLLVSAVQPNDLHFAMLLLGAKGSGLSNPGAAGAVSGQINSDYLKSAPKLTGDSISLTAKWSKNGNEKVVPLEDFLFNTQTKKSAEHGPWIYTGSWFNQGSFMAQIDGCFAAVVTNPSALINNPRKGNDDDQTWIPNKKTLPPRDTALEITLKLLP